MTNLRRAAPAMGAALLILCFGTACGGGTSSASSAGAAAPTSSPSASGPRRFGGPDSAQFAKIRQCLQAAGIALPTPSPRPSGSPGVPRPSRSPGQGGGRAGFTNPKVQAALKACGITPPSPGSFRRPGASPSPGA